MVEGTGVASDNAEDEETKKQRIAQAVARCEAPIHPDFLVAKTPATSSDAQCSSEPPTKKQKPNRGMNKNKERRENVAAMKKVAALQLCPRLAYLNECDGSLGEPRCSQNHDREAFAETKLPNIADECPVLEALGVCPAGLNCRFSGHVLDGKNVDKCGVALSPNCSWHQKIPHIGVVPGEKNIFSEDLRISLRKKTYDFSRAEDLAKAWDRWHSQRPKDAAENDERYSLPTDSARFLGPLVEKERRRIDLRNKSILAPLTTVGNLPFRRLCVGLGCEVTVGEMALSLSIVDGLQSELALLRRHESEKCFGVQIAGGDVAVMSKAAQFIDERVDCDFVDINCGCPLDEVHRRGAGSRLMAKAAHLEGIVRCMSGVLKTKALTLKMRTAHMEDNKVKDFNGRYAHNLIPKLEGWGVSALVLHGRTARQRYTKLADWDYIKECSSRRRCQTPFIGAMHGVDSVMVGRGALIKPWLFTEIKEKRHWDISASERLDLIRDFSRYGLEHWGADSRGVETTRRFLLEWLSFTCRYVPIGLLEVQEAKINWRPRPYVGRNDLETKLASTNSKDWVEITEMMLGKVPDGFSFVPKHKSNAYQAEGMQVKAEDEGAAG
ncbi:unnamed protein product [Durusdinium trenchii]|uniref:tRNA-dihydrouridine(47) synthase [NAD(P)(+)] n=1 Tax=Durusdinium trenchii TaxID=1381693 RepID=A0ABP0P227_9DINO